MDSRTVSAVFDAVSAKMTANRDYLIELDAQNGDGDLGISMDTGFRAVSAFAREADEPDLGRLFMKSAKALNEASPSSLGTILSFLMMGMAKALKGKTDADADEAALAMEAGLNLIMEKAGSKRGEKTILDALGPGVDALKAGAGLPLRERLKAAADAAAAGSESTRRMRAVHGRAAYYGDKSLGVLDGGSAVGRLIFEGIAEAFT